MNNKEKYIQAAKDTIKKLFDVDIEVEFVQEADAPRRKAELAKQYGRKLDDFGSGLFMPADNGHPSIILVGYSDEHVGWIDIFHHELQHAIDWFQITKALGKQPPHFKVYTEFNASRNGTLYHLMAELGAARTQAERKEVVGFYKPQLVKRFQSIKRLTIIDVVAYLARVSVFAEIEGGMDAALLALIPQRDVFLELGNFMNRYEPTEKWYNEFKEKVDGLTIKEAK